MVGVSEMKKSLKDETGKYRPDVKMAVLAEASAGGVWTAVERFGVPFATVQYWLGQERKRQREAGRRTEEAPVAVPKTETVAGREARGRRQWRRAVSPAHKTNMR